jgi:glycosyltransferase involved in cell wall biosynthesis
MSRLRIAVVFDPIDEQWTSMDFVAQLLLDGLRRAPGEAVIAERVRAPMVRCFRRLPALPDRLALNADRLVTRFGTYPRAVRKLQDQYDVFHVSDHSYAQLVHELPPERTGVYCHDLDVFRSLVDPKSVRPGWFRLMARRVLSGMQRAAVVFFSTEAVRRELVEHGLVDPTRLVRAPYGSAPEFKPEGPSRLPETIERRIDGRRFLLHVGTSVPRKRLDVLFDTFAAVRAAHPGRELLLVQQGGKLSRAQRGQVERLGISDALVQPPKLERSELAVLYRRAAGVLVTSEGEGFGLPVLEALSCGAPVVASDLDSLREVGGDAVRYCPVGDVAAFVEATSAVLAEGKSERQRKRGLLQANKFSWAAHCATILDTYRRLGAPEAPAGSA